MTYGATVCQVCFKLLRRARKMHVIRQLRDGVPLNQIKDAVLEEGETSEGV